MKSKARARWLRGALTAIVCALWLIAAKVDAGEPPKIVLMRSPNAEPQMAHRLQAEFTNLGIAVIEVPDEAGGDSAGPLADIATRERAFAAIKVVSDARGITVWVADRLTDKMLVRTLPPSRTDVGGEVIALEVVELLRASLLELNLPQPRRQPSPPEVGALLRPAEAAAPPERTSRFHAEVAPTVFASPGGIGPTGHASLGLRYLMSSRLSSRVFVVLPVVPGNVSGPEGQAEIGLGMAGAAFDVALTSPSSDWIVRTGGALAIARLRTVGTSQSPLLGRVDTVYAAVPALVAAVHRGLIGPASLGLDVFGGISVPRPVILFAERQTAHWGRPLLGASLTLDLALD